MEYKIEKPENKHLVILVHGLNGSGKTWHGSEQRFVELLSDEQLIKEHYDLALFTYHTRIFEISWWKRVKGTARGLLKNRPKEDIEPFNVDIEDISRPLDAWVRGYHEKYTSITFITHSMGGLVTKTALTWLDDDVRKKIHLFISLSVPHLGSQLVRIGKHLFGNNPQIMNLADMGAFTQRLNERFANLDPRPKIVYQSGNQDTIVRRQAAIPPNVPANLIESTTDNHFSVVLVKNKKDNTLYGRIIRELDILTRPFVHINVSHQDGEPFGPYVEAILSSKLLNIEIDFVGYTTEELQTPLFNCGKGNIIATSVEEFVRFAYERASRTIPDFKFERSEASQKYLVIKK